MGAEVTLHNRSWLAAAWTLILLGWVLTGCAAPTTNWPDDAESTRATLQRVIDGDTIHVKLESGTERVRLYGIDAPEAGEPGAAEATRRLEQLLRTAPLRLRLVGEDPRDIYGRLIAEVYAGDLNVNQMLVAGGHAWAYRHYLGQLEDDERYCELEAAARDDGLGFWSEPVEQWIPPWEWRRGRRHAGNDYSGESAASCMAAMGGRRPDAAAGQDRGTAATAHPPGCDIKGNINRRGQKIYHLPGSEYYAATRINPATGERWFCTEEEAVQAGWRAPRQPPGRRP